MKTATLDQVKTRLGKYLDECVESGPLVITRRGKKVAVLLAPVDDDDLESLLLARNPRFQQMLDRADKSIDEGKGLSHEEFWAAVEKRAQERKKTNGRPATKKTKAKAS